MAEHQDTMHAKNVVRALKEYSSTYHIDLARLDFTLLGVQSFIKSCHTDSFVKFHDAYKKEYQLPEKILKDEVRFLQLYKIKIHTKKKRNIKLVYRIEKGEFCTYPILVLSPESTLPLDELDKQEMVKLLYSEINKIKSKHGFLVNIFSSCLVKDIKTFVVKIYKDGFTAAESLLLFEGIDPEVSQASKVYYHYKDKMADDRVKEVEENELIITYKKPIYGQAGLNAMGQRIAEGESNNLAKLEHQIDTKTVTAKESKSEIRYFAKKRGFVSITSNLLSISNQLVVQGLTRVEGKLTKNEENEVAVVISQTDVTRDGLGEGVELVSESVHITGHMGARSSVEGKDVHIDGATHIEAFVTAKNAVINRHRGTLRCHKADIKSLEGGTIYATHAHIHAAMGGKIYAEHVTIKSLKHNLKVYASKTITVERILGEDNHFIIDYRKLPVIQSKLQFLQDEQSDLKWEYEEAKKHSHEKVDNLKSELDKKEDEIKTITLSHYNAVITIMAPINGLNVIEFAVPEKQQSLIYRTTEAKTFEPFHLKKTEEKVILEPVGIQIEL